MENWLIASLPILLKTIASVFLLFVGLILIVRVSGLRTFAKMSSIDFATTIAMGTLLASVIMNSGQSIAKGLVAIIAVVAFQQLFSRMRLWSDHFNEVAENQPLLLMEGENILDENLRSSGVTRSDLIAKLREANVVTMNQVRAVVLETTGDISVLHVGENEDTKVDDILLEGVKR